MTSTLHPFQLLVAILAGWVNRHQQDVIEYLRSKRSAIDAFPSHLT